MFFGARQCVLPKPFSGTKHRIIQQIEPSQAAFRMGKGTFRLAVARMYRDVSQSVLAEVSYRNTHQVAVCS